MDPSNNWRALLGLALVVALAMGVVNMTRMSASATAPRTEAREEPPNPGAQVEERYRAHKAAIQAVLGSDTVLCEEVRRVLAEIEDPKRYRPPIPPEHYAYVSERVGPIAYYEEVFANNRRVVALGCHLECATFEIVEVDTELDAKFASVRGEARMCFRVIAKPNRVSAHPLLGVRILVAEAEPEIGFVLMASDPMVEAPGHAALGRQYTAAIPQDRLPVTIAVHYRDYHQSAPHTSIFTLATVPVLGPIPSPLRTATISPAP